MTKSPKRVALFVGREWSFPPAFMEEVQRRGSGVIAEYALIGASSMDQPCPYDVIIDRISHEVPYYRSYPEEGGARRGYRGEQPVHVERGRQVLRGDARHKLGVASPKTLALPNKSYVPGIVHVESLRNLDFRSTGRRSRRTWGCPASSRTPTAAAGRRSTSAARWTSCSTTTTTPAS